jgi:predicted ATP-grasp superfamily ATP-dependent carboligase
MTGEEINGVVIIEGHIQGLSNTRSLGEANIPVYVVDKMNCIAQYSKYCKKFFRCPDFLKDEFADFLVNLAVNEKLCNWILIPSNDHAVVTLARNKQRLEKHYKLITPKLHLLTNIYDKSKLLKIAVNSGVAIPRTIYFSDSNDPLPDNFEFPVLTKGREGLSFYKTMRRKAYFAKNESELRKQLKEISIVFGLKNTFTQEVISCGAKNKTISFTAFSVNGDIKTFWMGVKLREHPIRFGTATFAESVYEEQCLSLSKYLLKTLNYTGVCEVEYILDPLDGKYKLIEINARTWLWVGLAKACGIDYAGIIYDFFTKDSVSFPIEYKIGVKWRNAVLDSIFGFIGLLTGKYNLKEYFSSLKGPVIHSVYDKYDLLPSIMYFLMLPYFFFKR